MENRDDITSSNNTPKGFVEKARSLLEVVRDDANKATLSQRLGLLATAAWLTYEWGPGNETVTPILATQLSSRTDGLEGIAIASLVTGGFTALQQTASGYSVARSVETFDGLAQKSYEIIGQNDNSEAKGKSFNELRFPTRLAYSGLLGSSFVVVREATLSGKTDRDHLRKQVRSSAILSAGAVTALTAGAVGAVDNMVAASNDTDFERPAGIIADGIENPLLWIGLAGTAMAVGHYRNKSARRKATSQTSASS